MSKSKKTAWKTFQWSQSVLLLGRRIQIPHEGIHHFRSHYFHLPARLPVLRPNLCLRRCQNRHRYRRPDSHQNQNRTSQTRTLRPWPWPSTGVSWSSRLWPASWRSSHFREKIGSSLFLSVCNLLDYGLGRVTRVPRKCTAYLRHLNLPNQRLEKVGHVDREKHETAENPRHFHNSAYVITVLSPVFPVKRICRLRLIFVSVSPSIRQSDRFIGQETEEFPNIVR